MNKILMAKSLTRETKKERRKKGQKNEHVVGTKKKGES